MSVLPVGKGDLVIKSDMLVKKTDVPRGMKTWQIARKSMAACVSDFAAKGVQPKASIISLGLPSSITLREVRQLSKGFKRAKAEYNFEIVGGDTNEANDVIIDCCMLGFAEKIVERHGASSGDRLIVTGCFGYPPLGLQVLESDLKTPMKIRNKAVDSIIMPTPKLDLGLALAKSNLLSAAIDSSDGLALSLYQLAEANEVGIELFTLPTDQEIVDAAKSSYMDVDELVLYGGEEYEIVACVPEQNLDQAKSEASALGYSLIEIGTVTDDRGQVLYNDASRRFKVERRGWIHLQN